MSVKRPKTRRVAVTASERDVAGHMVEASGISSSFTSVGVMTLDPVMKNSYMDSQCQTCSLF